MTENQMDVLFGWTYGGRCVICFPDHEKTEEIKELARVCEDLGAELGATPDGPAIACPPKYMNTCRMETGEMFNGRLNGWREANSQLKFKKC